MIDYDYTPTTDEVRSLYAGGQSQRDWEGRGPSVFLTGFDRWLAAHDREVAAKAWDEGYKAGRSVRLLLRQEPLPDRAEQ